jgi:hypothetical protein
MKTILLIFCLFNIFFNIKLYALSPGDEAINFELENQFGKKVKLSDFKGKYIILEWYNHGCPYVKKHYGSGNMQTLQKLYFENDLVTWLTIVSSAPGRQGYLESSDALKGKMKEINSFANHMLRDNEGLVGLAYGAKTTPHVYIIDNKFKVQYMGAIDSIASNDPNDIKNAKNYITSSISKLMLQQLPKPQKTKPYGCSVKY